MDVFRFLNPEHPTKLERGLLINGLKTKMWAERYRPAGEFEFTANIDTGAHKQLPIGSLISHVETYEVMIVENHEIQDDIGKQTEVKITGRSFESFLENRFVGSNKNWVSDVILSNYTLASAYSWVQAVRLLKDHISLSNVLDPDDALLNVQVLSTVVGTSTAEARSVARKDLYSGVVDLLAVDDLGIRTYRPGPLSPLGFSSPDMAIVIHQGLDLTSDVMFSHLNGDIESADYLWSNKNLKNTALVIGRWVGTMVKPEASGYDRRVMLVDGSDLDDYLEKPPSGITLLNTIHEMEIRGRLALASQRDIAFIKAETTKSSTMYKYRENYELGDIVTVQGEHSETAPMQVTEYVEIEDDNGQSGYPTFSVI